MNDDTHINRMLQFGNLTGFIYLELLLREQITRLPCFARRGSVSSFDFSPLVLHLTSQSRRHGFSKQKRFRYVEISHRGNKEVSVTSSVSFGLLYTDHGFASRVNLGFHFDWRRHEQEAPAQVFAITVQRKGIVCCTRNIFTMKTFFRQKCACPGVKQYF